MIWIVFLYLLSIAVGMFFEYCSQRTVWKFRQRFYCLVRQDLFDALLKKQYVDFKKHDLSEYLSFFQNDIDVFRQYLEACIAIFQTVLQLFVYGFFLFSLDWRLAVVIILSSFASLIVPKLTGKQISEKKAVHLNAMAAYTDTIRDLLSGFRMVNRETRQAISQRHRESVEETEQKEYEFGKCKTLTNVVTGSSMYFLQSVVFCVFGIFAVPKTDYSGNSKRGAGIYPGFLLSGFLYFKRYKQCKRILGRKGKDTEIIVGGRKSSAGREGQSVQEKHRISECIGAVGRFLLFSF